MSQTESRADAGCFLAARPATQHEQQTVALAILGVPFDGAVSYRAGARFGPREVRAASDSIETYCPKHRRDLDGLDLVDFGDLEVGPDCSGEELIAQLDGRLASMPARRTLVIGGDHLVALSPLKRALAAHPNLHILHVDAHGDLREDWEGNRMSHATVLARALELMGEDHRLIRWGIRSGPAREFEIAQRDPRIEDLAPEREAGLARVRALAAARVPVYLTLDADGIDPADIPGTGTPEPDGLAYGWVEDMIVGLAETMFVGADLVELAPTLDPSGRTAVAGARLGRALLLSLAATL